MDLIDKKIGIGDEEDLVLGSMPTEFELQQIEQGDGFSGDLDLSEEGIESLVEKTRNEVASDIDNTKKTWCEAASHLDGSYSTEKTQLENGSKIGNTASPFSAFQNK